jgi:hypothetical protein
LDGKVVIEIEGDQANGIGLAAAQTSRCQVRGVFQLFNGTLDLFVRDCRDVVLVVEDPRDGRARQKRRLPWLRLEL